jgi:DNA-directed RNA polymerase subunit L
MNDAKSKSNGTNSSPAALILAALTTRLQVESERDAAETDQRAAEWTAQHPGDDGRAVIEQRKAAETGWMDTEDRAVVKAVKKTLEMDQQCRGCHGMGWNEREERAEVPGYKVTTFRAEHPSQDRAHFVDAPKIKIRVLHEQCAGRGRTLTAQGVALLENLVRILRDEINPEAASIDEFNAAARAHLAAQVKTHESERARHEAADRFEREMAEKAAAIRAGKIPAPSVQK